MKYLYIILFITGIPCVKAQEKKWTLNECMEYAVENSWRTSRQKIQTQIEKQNYIEAIGGLLPSVSAGIDGSFNFGRGVDPETNTYITTSSFRNSYSLSSSLTLFDGLAAINRVKLQKINRMAGKETLQYVKDMVAFETMELFFNVLYYQGTVEIAQKQLEESEVILKQIQRMEELGLKSFPDLAEMQAQTASDRYVLTRQENLLALETIRLKEKMNYPLDEDLLIADSTTTLPVEENIENVRGIFTHALSFTPRLREMQYQLKAYEINYSISKGSNFSPVIQMGAGIGTEFSRYMDGSEYMAFWDQLNNRRGHYISFSLSIPVFNGFSRFSNVKRSKMSLNIARLNYEESKLSVYSEIEQAITDRNGQAEEYRQANKKTEAMEVAYKVNQRKYEEGMISAIDFNTSANRLLQARVDELNALLKYHLKHKLVEYYKGHPFINE